MPEAISNTSPLLYLYRAGAMEQLSRLFASILVPRAVVQELDEGRQRGFDVPAPSDYSWLTITEPRQVPSEWFALDLGRGEIAAMALALENPNAILLLDDALARRVAEAAGITVWGTLRVLLAAKENGLVPAISPYIDRLQASGMWLSAAIRQRLLRMAGE